MSDSKTSYSKAFRFCSSIQQHYVPSGRDQCFGQDAINQCCSAGEDCGFQTALAVECDSGSNDDLQQVTYYANAGSRSEHAAWCPDSGASIHAINDARLFVTITDSKPTQRVRTANGQTVNVVLKGTVKFRLSNSKSSENYLLRDVCYIPTFPHNLLSIRRLAKDHNIKTVFGKSSYFRTPSREKYPIQESGNSFVCQVNFASTDTPELWHKRFMHLGQDGIKRCARHIPALSGYSHDPTKCPACQTGAAKSKPFGGKDRRTYTYFGQRLSSDLCGPFPESVDGFVYACLFHDRWSKYYAVYLLKDKTKESVLEALQLFLSDHKNQLSHGITTLHSDNGPEYTNTDINEFCEEIACRRTYTVPYSPQLNPYAERTWGSLLRKVRTVLADSKAPEVFWSYAIKQAALVGNAVPRKDGDKSPYELVWSKPFDYHSLHVWGSRVYYLLPERDRHSKFSPRALPGVYLGEDPQRLGHVVWVPELRRITTGYHVVFSEDEYYDFENGHRERVPRRVRFQSGTGWYREERDLPPGKDPHCEACQGKHVRHTCGRTRGRGITLPGEPSTDVDLPSPAVPDDDDSEQNPYEHCDNPGCEFHKGHSGPCSNRISARRKQLPLPSDDDADATECVRVIIDDFTFDVLQADLSPGKITVPKSYEEAMASPQKEQWKAAMDKEIQSLTGNQTWDVVSRSSIPNGRKPTKSRWVFALKYRRDGTIDKYKARFVVCGYSQIEGVDYDRAFSATLRATSFRTLLAVAAGLKLQLAHVDVTSAFTQAKLDDVDIWIDAPKGFSVGDDQHGPRVLKLLQALYGTKQASRLWQETIANFLLGLGFTRSKTDPCIFHYDKRRRPGDRGQIIVGIYVDDLLVAHDGLHYNWFCKEFAKRFKSTPPTPLSWFLGMSIDTHSDGSISVSQSSYVEKMVEKFLVDSFQPESVKWKAPDPNHYSSLSTARDEAEQKLVAEKPYLSLVGSLLYAAVMTRPDIAYHTSILAKYMSNPSMACYDAAINLLKYLNGTKDKKLTYPGATMIPEGLYDHASQIRLNHGFVAYSDSSWGNKYPYPMFGYCIYLFGGLISFASKQMKIVALSSCEAEYVAAVACCKEITFVRNICADLGLHLTGSLVLAVDNTAAIDVAFNQGVSGRTKHFEMSLHYFRDKVTYGLIKPVYVSTTDQRADGFTKGLDKSKFIEWRDNGQVS